jgi:hypothetical protein
LRITLHLPPRCDGRSRRDWPLGPTGRYRPGPAVEVASS